MDDRRFDAMVRRAATGSRTRRGALLGLLTTLASGVGVADGRKRCTSGLSRCTVGKKRRCVELATDPAHCGACGTACAAGETCAAGVCTGTCIPTCDGRQCGDDGCGGWCGQCGGGERCRDGRCLESEDEWPSDPGPNGQCIADNELCGEGESCCDPQRTCATAIGECSDEPICCGVDRASCKRDCDCCGRFRCGKDGTCFRPEQG